jgi:hypothetical protein
VVAADTACPPAAGDTRPTRATLLATNATDASSTCFKKPSIRTGIDSFLRVVDDDDDDDDDDEDEDDAHGAGASVKPNVPAKRACVRAASSDNDKATA